MTRFTKIPGQEPPQATPWPSSNRGWRFMVVVSSAVVLIGTVACTIGGLI